VDGMMNVKSIWKNFRNKQQLKAQASHLEKQMEKAFHTAKMFLELEKFGNKVYVYPSIQSVRFVRDAEYWEIVFNLPRGINPSDVVNKRFIFQQYLGEEIEIEPGIIKFIIRIFSSKTKVIHYKYDELPIKNKVLPIVAGKNRRNEWVTFSLVENPTILIAGVMGSGKSVCIRSLLSTLMLHHPPQGLHFYLADFKQSEFHLFENYEHVKKVCYTPEDFEPIMYYLFSILEKRGALLRKYGVSHINNLPKGKKPPYIVLAIDEMLMLSGTDYKETNKRLLRWVSLGRALGCYTIISLQRPCNKSLSTQLRGLLNVRMIHKTEDKTNSEIAGVVGADEIKRSEAGKMIFKIDRDDMQHVQGLLLEEDELKEILEPFKRREGDQQSKEDSQDAEIEQHEEKIFGLLD
jgi:DNA segregation ATPase FtsK/SpoIIIE, S-DNA-T family